MKIRTTSRIAPGLSIDFGPFAIEFALAYPKAELIPYTWTWIAAYLAIGPLVLLALEIDGSKITLTTLNCYISIIWS